MAVADGSVHDAAVVSRAIALTNPGERRRAVEIGVPLVLSLSTSAKAEGRADCSWFDELTTSGGSANGTAVPD